MTPKHPKCSMQTNQKRHPVLAKRMCVNFAAKTQANSNPPHTEAGDGIDSDSGASRNEFKCPFGDSGVSNDDRKGPFPQKVIPSKRKNPICGSFASRSRDDTNDDSTDDSDCAKIGSESLTMLKMDQNTRKMGSCNFQNKSYRVADKKRFRDDYGGYCNDSSDDSTDDDSSIDNKPLITLKRVRKTSRKAGTSSFQNKSICAAYKKKSPNLPIVFPNAAIQLSHDRDSRTYEHIFRIYEQDRQEAAALVFADINTSIPNLPERQARELSEHILKAIVEVFPSQHMWDLYTRWAKKTPNHYQTDSISILRCLNNSYPGRFKNEAHILQKIRTLVYKPATNKAQKDTTKNI